MTVKSSTETRSTSHSRRAEGTSAPKVAPAPKPQPQPKGLASGFSDSKVAELRELAAGITLGEKPQGPAFKAESGFDRPVATADGIKGGATAEVSGKVKGGAGGYGLALGASAKATGSVSLGTKDGMTTVKVSAEISGTVSAEVKAPIGGVKGSFTAGVEASYTVSIPEAAAKTLDPSTVNPLDPSTMPTGSVVKLDSEAFTETTLGASFKALSVDSGVKQGEGTSITIEKTGEHTVKVTAGPTKTVEATSRVGLGVAGAGVGLGRTDELDGATLRSAEFDLSTPEGAKAYSDFMNSGALPAAAGPGVSGTTKTEFFKSTSTSSVDARLGEQKGSLELGSNEGIFTRTTAPDGTITGTADVKYAEGAALRVAQRFDADGTERLDERTYSYTMTPTTPTEVAELSLALGRELEPGQTVTVTLTEQQMGELRTRTDALRTGSPVMSIDPETFAIGLAAMSRQDGALEHLLFQVSESTGAQALSALPAEIIIKP